MYNLCKDQVIKDQIINLAELVVDLGSRIETLALMYKLGNLNDPLIQHNIYEFRQTKERMQRALRAVIAQYAEQTQGAPQDTEIMRLMCGSGEALSDGEQ